MNEMELIKEIYDFYYRKGNYKLTDNHREKIEDILKEEADETNKVAAGT